LVRYLSCTRRTVQGNDFELILAVKMETRHHVEGYFGSEYVIIAELRRPKVARPGNMLRNVYVFWKTTLYGKIVKLLFRKFSPPHRSTLLCSNFVKCCGRKSAKLCVIYQTKNACLSNSRYCTDRAQNLPGPTPNNLLRVFQISFKSVYVRRSYSRTREHGQNCRVR